MTNCVRWYGHVLSREDGHVLRRALNFEAEGQKRKGSPRRMKVIGRKGVRRGCGKSRLIRKCGGWFEKGRCTLPFKVECWS